MRSASPPAATAERAGIAEASPAGETSGRGAVPRPAQDGETSTVDQSREWPYRDTAPRQDPAESRLDPIWGTDPPDAVRWHMGMTPADQDSTSSATSPPGQPSARTRPATGSPNDQSSSQADAQPHSHEAPTISPMGSGADEGTVAPRPDPDASQPPQHQPGEHERPSLDNGEVVAAKVAERPTEPAAGHAAAEHKAQIRAAGGPPPQGESAPIDGRHGQGRDEGAREVAGLSSQRQALGHDQAQEDQDQGDEAELGTAAHGSTFPPEAVPAPVSHDPTPQVVLQAAQEDPASGAVSRPGDSATIGWFSTSVDPAQVSRALSERLSAERPVDEPVGGLAAEEDASPSNTGEPAATSPATGHPTEPTATPTSAGSSQAEESHGAGAPRSPERGSSASEAAIAMRNGEAPTMPSGEAPRGPELIEAGMVYVDPDPELGSPSTAPKAAGWGEQSPAPTSPASGAGWQAQPVRAGSPDVEENAESPSLTAENPVSTGPAHDPAIGSAGPQGQHDAGVPDHQHPHGAEVQQNPSGASGTSQATAAGDAGSVAERPWTEPALPMGGLPPGAAASSGGSASRQYDETATDEASIPRPDPSWPRLFDQRHGTSQPRGEGASNHRVPAESSPGTGSETGANGLADQTPPTPGSSPSATRSTGREMAAQAPTAEEQVSEPATVVDLTGMDAPTVSEAAPAGPGQRLGGSSGPASPGSFAGGAGTPEQENISTVAQIADAAEVDLRDQPVGSPGEDVSRETSAGGGEGMDPTPEEEALEDEAALAVREAVSRAAAEAGVDVSRETEFFDPGTAFDGPTGEQRIDSEAAAKNARVSFRIHRGSLNGTRRVLAVANQKGGVGKSTTAVNIGAYLALAGARVLVVDLDPQGNASTGLGLDHRDIEPSIYDVLTGDTSPTAAIRATSVANLHVLPSTIDLAGAEVELVSAMSRETRLRRALESIDHQYDTILIDCPPSLGLLTVNALAAADELLIPIQCEYYALEGLGQLLRNVELVRANLNPELRIGGIALTMYDGRTRLALQVVDEVRKHFTDLVYQTVVPRSVRLSEAPGYGLPIALYDPLSRGGIAYRDLTFELAERSGLLAPTGEGAS